MAEALLKPGTVGNAVFNTDSTIGKDGDHFFMKVQTVSFNFSTKVQDTTGDGDSLPHYDIDEETRGQVEIRGFMIADSHIGIENLNDNSKNPIVVDMNLGTGTGGGGGGARKYKFKMVISNIIVDWNRVAGLVGVAMRGVISDSKTTNFSIDEA